MVLKNALFIDKNFEKQRANIKFDGDIITEISEDAADKFSEVDLSGMLVVPGFVDAHIHGCGGADCSDMNDTSISKMSKTLALHGVTSFVPAIITDTKANQMAFLKNISKNKKLPGANMVGIRAEGPYLSAKRAGAHDPEKLRLPTADELSEFMYASDNMLKVIDVAPELENAISFIRASVYAGLTVSVGHTDCDYDTACAAFEAGATDVTHLYNAMSPFTHREPGVIGATFDSPKKPFAEIICDGIHIHPAAVRMAVRMLGNDRTVFISDAMEAAGLSDGEYTLGGDPVIVKNGEARRISGVLAGSTLTLDVALKRAVSFNIPFTTALRAITINPARMLNMDDKIGTIEVGKRADFAVLDHNLNVVMTFVGGKLFNRGLVK